jgi:hypothetical protein
MPLLSLSRDVLVASASMMPEPRHGGHMATVMSGTALGVPFNNGEILT